MTIDEIISRRLCKITVKRKILRKGKKKTPINEYEFFKLFHSTKTTRERERHSLDIT